MTSSEKSLQDLLDSESGSNISPKKIFGYLVFTVLGLSLIAYLLPEKNDQPYSYETEKLTTGSLIVTVSASGKLRPTNQVEVGSELSGIIESVYVDENDVVKAGQILAQLDTSKLRDTVEKSRAALMGREAAVAQVRATLSEFNTNLYRLRQLYKLSNEKIPSQNKIDAAVANVRRAQADEASALAAVNQAKADLRSDETNLSKATLISPISGVVLKRSVEPGQTVAASFQAPVLFTIAEDLSKMELYVDVDEADVGNIKNGQKSYFTVDAWPDREYSANIRRISFAAEINADVVTYPTILDVDNSDLSLRPGMTGTAFITTLALTNQLLVPNAAFRVDLNVQAENKKPNKSVFRFLFPSPQTPKQKVSIKQLTGLSKLWLLTESGPTEIAVEILATNQKFSAVAGTNLQPGADVIIDAVEQRP
ncbi:MAG: efflux RND transporter periplasmic adaptor subunit [Proteobacteria bacterium]|nr:efflux RND transporter periplasmic adaptor subunit [Pseudomonadota bacterium]